MDRQMDLEKQLKIATKRMNYHKIKRKVAQVSRNRMSKGLEYWKKRALLSEKFNIKEKENG